jgi:hypothetical protein
MSDGNSVILDPPSSRTSRLTRSVSDAGSPVMGTPTNARHTNCFKHPTLSGNDQRDIPFKSKILSETILLITFLGISLRFGFPAKINENISGARNDSGSDLNLL